MNNNNININKGVLSGKIYDDTSFFSKNMLFGRFTDESKLSSVVYPAFKDYLEDYLVLMENAIPNYDSDFQSHVKSKQVRIFIISIYFIYYDKINYHIYYIYYIYISYLITYM